MNAVLIFDVSQEQQRIKEKLTQIGYYNRWTSKSSSYYLPNNVMWKPNIELPQAKKDLETIVATVNNETNLNITIQRLIILSSNPWDGIEGIQS